VRDAKPDGIVLISYYADGALISRQIRSVGLTTPIVASGSVYSPKFIELAGDAANGVFSESISSRRRSAEVQAFVTKFRARYNEEPDDFNAVAYDTIVLLAAGDRQVRPGPQSDPRRPRRDQRRAERHLWQGDFRFPRTRRIAGAPRGLSRRQGRKFALWDGVKPIIN